MQRTYHVLLAYVVLDLTMRWLVELGAPEWLRDATHITGSVPTWCLSSSRAVTQWERTTDEQRRCELIKARYRATRRTFYVIVVFGCADQLCRWGVHWWDRPTWPRVTTRVMAAVLLVALLDMTAVITWQEKALHDPWRRTDAQRHPPDTPRGHDRAGGARRHAGLARRGPHPRARWSLTASTPDPDAVQASFVVCA